jgi:hypothetical protein
MKRLLGSSRFRRRSGWLAVCLAVAGVVAFVGIRYSNTGHSEPQHFTSEKPQLVEKSPKSDVFTLAEQKQVRAVAIRFVETAVYRKQVGTSFAITTSGLHEGLSRTAWARGSIPIVPFPEKAVETVRWRLDYSYATEVGLKVAFYTKPASRVDRQVFDISLENHGTAASPRWLVSYWAPSGGVQLAQADPRARPIDMTASKPALGAIWLLLPVGLIFGGLFGLIAFLAVRGRIRHARATRLYRSSSSPS